MSVRTPLVGALLVLGAGCGTDRNPAAIPKGGCGPPTYVVAVGGEPWLDLVEQQVEAMREASTVGVCLTEVRLWVGDIEGDPLGGRYHPDERAISVSVRSGEAERIAEIVRHEICHHVDDRAGEPSQHDTRFDRPRGDLDPELYPEHDDVRSEHFADDCAAWTGGETCLDTAPVFEGLFDTTLGPPAPAVGTPVLDVPLDGRVRALAVDATQLWVAVDGLEFNTQLHRIPRDGGPIEVFGTPLDPYVPIAVATDPDRGTVLHSDRRALFLEPEQDPVEATWGGGRDVARVLPSPSGWWLVFYSGAPVELIDGVSVDVGLGGGPGGDALVFDRELWTVDGRIGLPEDCTLAEWGGPTSLDLPGPVVAATDAALLVQQHDTFTELGLSGDVHRDFTLCDDPLEPPARCAAGFDGDGGLIGGRDRFYRWWHADGRLRVERL